MHTKQSDNSSTRSMASFVAISNTSSKPLCFCGQVMVWQHAGGCYLNSEGIVCDECGRQQNGTNTVYHCVAGFAVAHKNGFDLCQPCGDALSQRQSLSPPTKSDFIVVPHAVIGDDQWSGDKPAAFERRSLYYWHHGKRSNVDFFIAPNQSRPASLSAYLQSRQGSETKKDYIQFNANREKQQTHFPLIPPPLSPLSGPPITHPFAQPPFLNQPPLQSPTMKYKANLSQRHQSQSIIDSNFPALIAVVQERQFAEHLSLKQAMNEYQANDAEDISVRRMTEKTKTRKWKVLGLIDPDKHLSTLDHSLDAELSQRYQVMNITIGFPRRMTEKTKTRKWKVLGLIDPDKHLSTLDLAELSQRNWYQVMNYHHWIPSVFQVNGNECRLLSDIANLNPYKYGASLYRLLEKLFLLQLPSFESVTNLNLRGIPLKVVVKAQDYQLFGCQADLNECYVGNMHKEGLYEDVIAVALYYYHIDESVRGGQLQLSSVIQVQDTEQRQGATTLERTEIAVQEGTSLVFCNDKCYHRVSELYGSGSRKIIAFFLLRPNGRSFSGPIDAGLVVVNWKFHGKQLLLKWLRDDRLVHAFDGYEWMIQIVSEFLVGDRRYIEDATELFNECRRGYAEDLTFDESDITSNGHAVNPFPYFRAHRLD
eukprot:CAMPEP_0202729184 /NCGR_PEP_ID=MMETSP1385-20130828/186003_1 /ASSEMBLY_ACC=CAM_ASM_000861 /TAXON_ID=933848 /ORGANISM="Elphidium margaritaceum" /LENGTH=649 /DNA_ID=CAMNT_0049395441 /DNA_START=45 /DNA_END=1995 /DNA_ORIENTATION=+